MNLLNRYNEKRSSIPPPGSGSHLYLLSDADCGIPAGLSVEQIFSDRQQELYATVKKAVDIGLSIWPPKQDGSKAPIGNGWKDRQATPARLDELSSIYKHDSLTGIGVVCGKVSGNVECLDFDERSIYERFKEASIATGLQPLLDRIEAGYKEHSPNGVHLLYGCEEIGGSTKLATRPKRPEEMNHENDKTKTLIETKGEGGYVIIAPTYGGVNIDGTYDVISGSLTTIPTITPEERRDLFSLARTFHIDPDEKIASHVERAHVESKKAGGRPGDDFNERATWPDILDPHGWQTVYEKGGVIYLRRPGKSRGISATIGHNGADLFHCFTSSSQFDPNRSYARFTAYAVLNHDGDFSAAAKELAQQGYGDKSTPQENQTEAKNSRQDPESWPEPIPFNDYSHLPEFPVSAIPGVCGEMVQALADSCQVDTGLPGTLMLAALSTAIGGKIRVSLGTHSEPGNIYAIAIVGSGNRKSEVLSQLAEPIYSYQQECQKALVPIIREAENKHEILKKRLDKLQKDAARTDDPIERETIIRCCNDVLKEMEAKPIPPQEVFLVDDITPEALGQTMADNGERMSILSAEGGIFRIIAGLYHNGQANIDLFLKAHAGDYWSNNRIGRESKRMVHPRLTLGLAVQPDVIEEIGQNSEFRGRGLSARFLYSLCQSKAGYRTRQSSPVPGKIKDLYHEGIVKLMAHSGGLELTLTPDAQPRWDSFYNEVETRLRPGRELEHIVDWGSKLPGAVARITGLLHFADFADGFPGNLIQEKTVLSACEIGSYYLQHAKAVFGMMKEDSTITMAKKILNYIKSHNPTTFKGRDLFDHTNCQSMQEVQPALNNLVERGYIREFGRKEQEIRKGRPESTKYEVNPKIFPET